MRSLGFEEGQGIPSMSAPVSYTHLFAPDRSISRAEAMTLVNRVLGRLPETADDLLDGMITWPDNPPDAWYYLAVQEATNSHDYGRKADTVHETWTGLQPVEDWTRYEQ